MRVDSGKWLGITCLTATHAVMTQACPEQTLLYWKAFRPGCEEDWTTRTHHGVLKKKSAPGATHTERQPGAGGSALPVKTGSYTVATVDTRFNAATAVSGNTIDVGPQQHPPDGPAVIYDNGGGTSISRLVDPGVDQRPPPRHHPTAHPRRAHIPTPCQLPGPQPTAEAKPPRQQTQELLVASASSTSY